MAQELKLKVGNGSVSAALPVPAAAAARTNTTVSVVTLPTDNGYLYDVSISVLINVTTGGGGNTVNVSLAGYTSGSLTITSAGSQVDVFPNAAIGTGTGGLVSEIPSNRRITLQYGPGGVVTVEFLTMTITSASVCTYDIQYSYIGRKIVNNSF